MKRGILFAAALALAAPVSAQEDLFPPGVLLLSRVQRHVKEELARLPNISCIETVQREIQQPGRQMRPLDMVRLEVLTDGVHELYAAPGERKFSDGHPVRYVGSGMIGDGYFGLYLKEALASGAASYEYKGEEDIGGRRLAHYDFRVPVRASGHHIALPDGAGTVGLRGSFWAEPQHYDVIRLETRGEDFPPTLPLTESVTVINYAPTAVGENTAVLLPVSGDYRMTRFSGEISHNHMEFTHCRLFGAQSTINFGAPDAPGEETPRFGASSNDDTLRPLPPGLQLAIRLSSRISAENAVGVQIEGTVAGNVPAKGPVVIAGGSRVRGRIRRLERYTDPFPNYVVAIEFTEVESVCAFSQRCLLQVMDGLTFSGSWPGNE